MFDIIYNDWWWLLLILCQPYSNWWYGVMVGFCFFQSLGLSLVSIYHWPIKCYSVSITFISHGIISVSITFIYQCLHLSISVSITFISHGIIIYDSKLFPGNTTRSQLIMIYNNYDYNYDYDHDIDQPKTSLSNYSCRFYNFFFPQTSMMLMIILARW